jgi:hypothetical protein
MKRKSEGARLEGDSIIYWAKCVVAECKCRRGSLPAFGSSQFAQFPVPGAKQIFNLRHYLDKRWLDEFGKLTYSFQKRSSFPIGGRGGNKKS